MLIQARNNLLVFIANLNFRYSKKDNSYSLSFWLKLTKSLKLYGYISFIFCQFYQKNILNMNYLKMGFVISIFLTVMSSSNSWAKDKIISGSLINEFFNNYTYDSNNPKNEFNENYLRSLLDLKVKLHKNLSLNARLNLEETNPDSEESQRSASSKGGGNKSFEDEELGIKILNLSYDYKYGEFIVGKFETKFGTAWKRQDNIVLFDKARDAYREDEKLGFANYIKVGDEKKNGLYILGLSIFTNDSKNLDGKLIIKDDTASKNEGIPGDERGLKSYVASMDIDYDFGNEEKLSYHLSYLNLGVNKRSSPVKQGKIQDEKRYALAMNYQYPLHKNILANGFVEYVNITNRDGDIDKDVDFLTTTLSLQFFKNYSMMLGRYKERTTELATNGVDTDVRELNFGYKFSDDSIFKNLTIMTGITREKIDKKTSKVINEASVTKIGYLITF